MYNKNFSDNLNTCKSNCKSKKCGGLDGCDNPCNVLYINKNYNGTTWRLKNQYNNTVYDYDTLIFVNTPTFPPTTETPDSSYYIEEEISNYVLKSKKGAPDLNFETNYDGTYIKLLSDLKINDITLESETMLFLNTIDNIYYSFGFDFFIYPINCENNCLTFKNDDNNCGSCGNKCKKNEKCCGKKCIPIIHQTCNKNDCFKDCGVGFVNCGGECVANNIVDINCNCLSGYKGESCQYSDTVTCSGHGKVDDHGTCTCVGNWVTRDASTGQCNFCPSNFDNSDGTCTKCADGYGGANCACKGNWINPPDCKICPSNFKNSDGTCKDNDCVDKWTGAKCNICPPHVYNNLDKGECKTCLDDWGGDDCSKKLFTDTLFVNGPCRGSTTSWETIDQQCKDSFGPAACAYRNSNGDCSKSGDNCGLGNFRYGCKVPIYYADPSFKPVNFNRCLGSSSIPSDQAIYPPGYLPFPYKTVDSVDVCNCPPSGSYPVDKGGDCGNKYGQKCRVDCCKDQKAYCAGACSNVDPCYTDCMNDRGCRPGTFGPD